MTPQSPIACASCCCYPTFEEGQVVRAPDGWGVITSLFKVQGLGREHRIGDKVHRIGSQGMGSAYRRVYLCPTCLHRPAVQEAYGLLGHVPAATPQAWTPGRRRLTP